MLISKVIATAAGNAHARESSRLRKLNRRVDELTARLENKKSRENVKSMRVESQERSPVLLIKTCYSELFTDVLIQYILHLQIKLIFLYITLNLVIDQQKLKYLQFY